MFIYVYVYVPVYTSIRFQKCYVRVYIKMQFWYVLVVYQIYKRS